MKYPSGNQGGNPQVWTSFKSKKSPQSINKQYANPKITTQREQDIRLLPQFRGKNY